MLMQQSHAEQCSNHRIDVRDQCGPRRARMIDEVEHQQHRQCGADHSKHHDG
jgi:hypothetical protein